MDGQREKEVGSLCACFESRSTDLTSAGTPALACLGIQPAFDWLRVLRSLISLIRSAGRAGKPWPTGALCCVYDCVLTCVSRRPWHGGGQAREAFDGSARRSAAAVIAHALGLPSLFPPPSPLLHFECHFLASPKEAVRSRADVAPGGEENEFHSTLQLGMIKAKIDIESPRHLSFMSVYKWR